MKRARRPLLVALVLALVLVNGLAFAHARSFTTYVPGAPPVPDMEALSWGEKLGMALFGPRLPRPENERSPLDLGLDFSTLRMVAEDGTQLEGWLLPRPGARGEIVLLHGYRGSREGMLEVAERFYERGWQVSLIDQRGSGGSEGNRTTLGWDESLDAAAAALSARERNPGRPVVLYGFSMGGAAILRSLSLGQAVVDAAIVEATFARFRDTAAIRFQKLHLPATPLADLLLFWGFVQNGTNGWAHDPVEYARQVRVPVLVVQGQRDWRAPPEDGRAIAAALPEGRYAELEDLGHQPGAIGRPLAWERAVEGFLWEVLGPAPEPALSLPEPAPLGPEQDPSLPR